MRVQYGALPISEQEGEPVVMLVTSRGTGRWIIPKGRPEKGVAPHKLAQREAWEEAGLIGRIQRKPIGRFVHPKRRADGSTVNCAIEVFRLDVDEELSDWPERGQRERCWCTLSEAIEKVGKHGLAKLLLRFDGYSRKDTGPASS